MLNAGTIVSDLLCMAARRGPELSVHRDGELRESVSFLLCCSILKRVCPVKIFQKTLSILIACAAVFLCNSCVEKNHLANVDAIVIAELERLSVVPEADAVIKH